MLEKALNKATKDALSIEGNLSILNLVGIIALRLE